MRPVAIGNAELLHDDTLDRERSGERRDCRFKVSEPLFNPREDVLNGAQNVLKDRWVRGADGRAASHGREHQQCQAEHVATASYQKIPYAPHVALHGLQGRDAGADNGSTSVRVLPPTDQCSHGRATARRVLPYEFRLRIWSRCRIANPLPTW